MVARRRLLLGSLAVFLGLTRMARASEAGAGAIVVSGAGARATPPAARTGAVYLVLGNRGDAVDRLIGAATTVAESVELHVHRHHDNVARMEAVAAFEVEPGASRALRPGEAHLMLLGLKAPLVEGATLDLQLTFERAGAIQLRVPVRRDPPAGTGHGH